MTTKQSVHNTVGSYLLTLFDTIMLSSPFLHLTYINGSSSSTLMKPDSATHAVGLATELNFHDRIVTVLAGKKFGDLVVSKLLNRAT